MSGGGRGRNDSWRKAKNTVDLANPPSAHSGKGGAPNTNRTCDLPLRRGLLYPLSYRGAAGEIVSRSRRADELREQPLLPATRREALVQRPRIGSAGGIKVEKEDRVAFASAVAQIQQREIGL